MTEPTDRMGELIERAGAAIERDGGANQRGRGGETPDMRRVSPLAGWSQAFAAASTAPARFSVRETPFVAQANVRGDPGDAAFAFAMRSALGHDLPARANTWGGTPARAVLWLGPDEWLITAPEGRNDTLARLLGNLLRGTHHSVADVSANRCVIELSGRHVRAVLAKGCSLDLHAKAFAPPQVAQTLLAKAQVLLQCIDTRPTMRLYARPSFAPYVAQWLTDAAAEFASSRELDSDRIAARLN